MRRTRKNSLRLPGYDYTQSGAYFLTVLAYRRLQLFGSIQDRAVHLSQLGAIVDTCWQAIPRHYPSVELDEHVVMPNHLHGILILHEDGEARPVLGRILGTFKGAVTRIARQSDLGFNLETPIWHRSFHDRIIRNPDEYNAIAQYIQANPARWEADVLNA